MRFVLFILASSLGAQGIPGIGGLGALGAHGGGGSSVSISGSGGINNTGACASNSTTCVISGVVVGATGDNVSVGVEYCLNASCITQAGCSVSLSDGGTNTYTNIASASIVNTVAAGIFANQYVFSATNATAGTYTLTFTLTGCGVNTMFYPKAFWVDLAGANHSTPVDGSVSNKATGNSGTATVSGAGTVTNAGEMALSWLNAANNLTTTGSFSLLLQIGGNAANTIQNLAPSSGASITASATQTSGYWFASIWAITP